MMCFLLIAADVAAAPTFPSPVTNGNFEAGDFSGGTQFGETGFTSVTKPFFSVALFGGAFHARFGPQSPGGIVQAIATVPGASRHLSVVLAQKLFPKFPNANFMTA